MAVNDQVASDQWYRYRWCVERGHYDYLEKAHRCDEFFVGNQWTEADLNKLKQQGRPALTINKILSTLSNVMGEQIYNRNEVLFRPSAGADPGTADALSKVWMQIAQNNQLPWVRSDVFCDGVIRSRGFYDVRLGFNDSMRGEIQIGMLNSKNVVIDPDAEEYDPDYWNDVFVTKWMTYQDIHTLYNAEDAEYLRDREASLFPYAYDSIERVRDRFSGTALQGSYYGMQDKEGVRRNIRVIERQFHQLDNQLHFVDVMTGDMRPIPEGWNRNQIASVMDKAQGQLNTVKKLIKRVRWRVCADHCVLHDDWSPYKHFTVVPYFPHFRHGKTVGIVEGLISSQELLNKTSSQELHIVNTTANSGWKVKKGALKNMTTEELKVVGAQTGLVLELDEIDGAEKIQPNQTPNGLDRISYKAEEHIKTISGVSDSMQGFDREDVAAKAIQYKRQQGSLNLVKVMDNLQRTDWLLARNVLDIIQAYYTEERIVHITHDDIMNASEQIVVNQQTAEGKIVNDLTLGEYQIVITSAPARDSLEDSQFEQAKGLRELGVPIPDDVLIENSRLLNRSQIIEKMKAATNSPQAQKEAELKLRAQEAEVTKLEGEAKEKHTKAGLDQARTQKELVQAQNEGQGDASELRKLEMQHQIDMEKLAMDRWKMEQEFQLKREAMAQELQLKREAAQQDAVIKQQQAEQQAQLTAQQAEQAEADHYAERAEKVAQPGKEKKE